MAKSIQRTATTAARPASKKSRPSPPPSDDFQDDLDMGDDSLELSVEDEELDSDDEFALGAGADLAMSGDDEQDGSDEDEEEDERAFLGAGSDDDMIGDDDEDLHAGLDGAGDAMSEDEDDRAADDDGWETVGTAPTKPLIAPAAELDKKRKGKQPKPLSPAELRALAFAELTASPISNVLATQVAGLLDPLNPPTPATSPLQPLLKSLHAYLTSLPSQKPISLAGLKKKGRTVPRVEGAEGKWAKIDLPWEKPRGEDVRVVGKWAWGGGLKEKGEYVVELAIAMPPTLLQPKDYLSPRFAVKSTHYLVTLSSLLPDSLGPVSLSYFPLAGSQGYALDIRSATPKGATRVGLGKIKHAVLRLRVVAPPSAFSASKLSPTSNTARPPSLTVAAADESNPQFDPSSLPPTPLHSTSLHLSSLSLLTAHLKYHHSLSTSFSSYASSARLLQTWATRRGYGSSLGLSSEWWAWCTARSLNASKSAGADVASLAAGGEAWAGWRKAVEWLTSANWTEGIWFKSNEGDEYSKEEFKEAFKGKPIFVDPTGTVNLAAGIDLSTLEMLKHDARETISLLLAGVEDERKFESAFVREVRAVERFDNFARIVVPAVPKVDADSAVDFAHPLDYLVSSISSTLRRALGNRVRAFALAPPAPSSIPVSSASSSPSSVVLQLGILLDPAQSLRLVDQGPSAEDEEACADFRAFWGRKSELRRFKDGAIVESVVWDESSAGGLGPQRNKIVHHIVKYILDERHGVPAQNVEFFAAAMDHLIVEPEAVRRSIFLEDSVATGKGFGNVVSAFDDLSKELKDLPDLPLTVSAVQPSSPSLRYSSIFTPSPRRLKDFEHQSDAVKFIAPQDILITLESSGRWPDNLEGIQKIKAAFLSKIGEDLEATRSVLRAELAFDVEARPIDDNVSLEILTSSGWAFRARIFYDRSQLLLEEREDQLGPAASTSSGLALSPLDAWSNRFLHAPKHHAAISNLQHHFTSYSHTVRLFKRWVSAHMLSQHFSDELLELVVASVLLDPTSPYDPPNSGATGFARVMERLVRWNWRDEPLLVPIYSFSNAITSGRRAVLPTKDRAEAVARFEQLRLGKPAMEEHAWVVVTEDDLDGTRWSWGTGKVEAARVRGLAKATLKTLEDGVVGGGLGVDQLFSPPLGDYAFLIHLDPSVIPRHFQSISPNPRALSSRQQSSVLSGSLMGQAAEDDAIRVGWDPVAEFVKHLERLYPSIFLLFHSADGASLIGGIWNPSVEGPKAFKVGAGYPVTPVEGADGKVKVELDKRAVLREIERLGKGLVVKVEEVKR
ncbi:hypothetical protein JCM8547_002416 [Rhodosporidiobolus lusitaniae]